MASHLKAAVDLFELRKKELAAAQKAVDEAYEELRKAMGGNSARPPARRGILKALPISHQRRYLR